SCPPPPGGCRPLCGRDTVAPMVNWSGVLRRARSAARWWVIGTPAAHGAAIATVLTVDRLRKRRYPPAAEVPPTPPRSVPGAAAARRARSAARGRGFGGLAAHGSSIARARTAPRARTRRCPPAGAFPRTRPRAEPVAESEMPVFTCGHHVYDAMLATIRAAE